MGLWLTDSDLNRYDFLNANIPRGFPADTRRRLINLAFSHGARDIGDQKIQPRSVRISSFLNGQTGGIIRQLFDCESTAGWTVDNDALDPELNLTYIKRGLYSFKFTTDISKHANQFATWQYFNAMGDLSDHTADWLHFWIYIPSLTGIHTNGIQVAIGSSGSDRIYWNISKASLSTGWNNIKLDMANPTATQGTPDWYSVDHFNFIIYNDDSVDFSVYVDDFKFWRISYQAEFDELMRWIGKQDLKFYKDASRYLSVKNMDLASHSFIIGNAKATAEIELSCPDPFFYKDTETIDGLLKRLDTFEAVGGWSAIGGTDAGTPAQESGSTYIKQGAYAVKFPVDASLSGEDKAQWQNNTNLGDLSVYKNDWVYFWIYFSTIDYLRASGGYAIAFQIGNDSSNFLRFDFNKSDLAIGWNLLKCDLVNPTISTGTINWTTIDWRQIVVYEIPSNINDFDAWVDDMKIVRPKSDGQSDMTWNVLVDTQVEKDYFNEGNSEVFPVFEIIADADLGDGIEMVNASDGNVLFSYTDSNFTSGKKLTVDCKEGTVDLDGTNTIRFFSGQFLKLIAGTNTLKFTGDKCQITVKHRDRWL